MKPLEVQATFVIADLSGFTALTETHGDMHAVNVVDRYVELVRETLRPGVRLIKRVGDEVFLVADDAVSAIRTTMSLSEAVAKEPLFPLIRVGIHAGKVMSHDGDYVGAALNLTARVASHARAGQVLCTEAVMSAAGGLEEVVFRPLGPVRFKNVADPVVVFQVVARLQGTGQMFVDPVCRMHIDPDAAPLSMSFRDQAYYFCSLACATTFAENPDAYAGA